MARNLSLQIISKLAPADLRKLSERDFQDAVLAYAKDQGWKCHWMRRNAMVNQKGEWHPLGTAGFPDIFAIRNGQIVAIECKSENGKATREQEDWLIALGENSETSAVIRMPRDAADIMARLDGFQAPGRTGAQGQAISDESRKRYWT